MIELLLMAEEGTNPYQMSALIVTGATGGMMVALLIVSFITWITGGR